MAHTTGLGTQMAARWPAARIGVNLLLTRPVGCGLLVVARQQDRQTKSGHLKMAHAIDRQKDSSEGSIWFGPSPSGRGYRLEASLFLPCPREKVFEFFSDAYQLQTLTPPWLHFVVLTPAPIDCREGTLIDYRLRIHGVPIRWQSRLSVWEPPLKFVDEQTRGPYRSWRHLHAFEEAPGGTLCRDLVDYRVYGGGLINRLFVEPDIRKIFAYRQARMRELFPPPGTPANGR